MPATRRTLQSNGPVDDTSTRPSRKRTTRQVKAKAAAGLWDLSLVEDQEDKEDNEDDGEGGVVDEDDEEHGSADGEDNGGPDSYKTRPVPADIQERVHTLYKMFQEEMHSLAKECNKSPDVLFSLVGHGPA
ncbi:hypothetical protein H0H92_010249, partial [Tricholoma furcatifolium]